METYAGGDTPSDKPKELKLITYVAVEPANESDSNALIPALESSTAKRGLAPKCVLVDSLYGSDKNTRSRRSYGGRGNLPRYGQNP